MVLSLDEAESLISYDLFDFAGHVKSTPFLRA
jgi:hypothetical protein